MSTKLKTAATAAANPQPHNPTTDAPLPDTADPLSGADTLTPPDPLSGADALTAGDTLPGADALTAGDTLPGADTLAPADPLSGADTLTAGDTLPGADTLTAGDTLPGAIAIADLPAATTETIFTKVFPGLLLAHGGIARRKAWAPGFELTASAAGGRGGQKMKLFTSGNRGGQLEWRPVNIADDLLADDWEVTLPVGVIAAIMAQ